MVQKVSFFNTYFLVILLCGCEVADDKLQDTTAGLFSYCENTFTVSGSNKIYLFEHRHNSVEFDQLAVFDDWSPISAFLDCAANRIIVPYGARKDDRNNAGVAIIDLESGSKLEYSAGARGIQGIPLKYNNGLLLSTTLLNQQNLAKNPPLYGYLPPGEAYKDSQSQAYRVFSPTTYFDLSSAKFTKDLPIDIGYSVIKNNIIYAKQRGAITAIDLDTKTTNVLYESSGKNSFEAINIPINHLGVFLDTDYFFVLNNYSHNVSNNELQGLEANAIYKLVDSGMQKLANYSEGDAVYLLGLNNKIYIFTSAFRVIEYDVKTMEVIERALTGLNQLHNFTIESVGYTEQNFILALGSQNAEIGSKVMLMSRDFTHISPATSVELRSISVTTDLAIDTANSRGIQLTKNNNSL